MRRRSVANLPLTKPRLCADALLRALTTVPMRSFAAQGLAQRPMLSYAEHRLAAADFCSRSKRVNVAPC